MVTKMPSILNPYLISKNPIAKNKRFFFLVFVPFCDTFLVAAMPRYHLKIQ